MKARSVMQRPINDCRNSSPHAPRAESYQFARGACGDSHCPGVSLMAARGRATRIASLAFVLLSCSSGLTAIAAHPTSRRNPPATENPIVRVAKQPLDCSGRYLGVGWGDGYHGCHGSGFRPGADLPPKSSHATRRRVSLYGNTYYDRFDNHNLIHPRNYRISGRSDAGACDQFGGCDEVGVWDQNFVVGQHDSDASHSIMEELVFDEPIIEKPVDVRPGVASPTTRTRSPALASATPATAASGVAHRLPLVAKPVPATVPTLPPTRASSAGVSPKPARLPCVSSKPCRVAEFVPTLKKSVAESLPQQHASRIAEAPRWAVEAAKTVQQNPFVR